MMIVYWGRMKRSQLVTCRGTHWHQTNDTAECVRSRFSSARHHNTTHFHHNDELAKATIVANKAVGERLALCVYFYVSDISSNVHGVLAVKFVSSHFTLQNGVHFKVELG
eukprot:scaffold5707_cov112-Cylindrotheca_fusiformis.AAC.16